MAKKYKFGLALSGGGMRGAAHCGVLKRLEELGLVPDIVSGVSAGAIVGSAYCDGVPVHDIVNLFKTTTFSKAIKPNMPKNGGVSSIIGYRNALNKLLHAKTFDELQIPLIINATNLLEGCNEYFTTGSVVDAVCASACVPIVFNPQEINGKLYIDGGMFCNLPAEILKEQCDFVMGIHVNPIHPIARSQASGVIDVAERAFHLAINGNTIRQKTFCDLVINMEHKIDVSMFDSSKAEDVYRLGYKQAKEALDNFDFSKYGITLKL